MATISFVISDKKQPKTLIIRSASSISKQPSLTSKASAKEPPSAKPPKPKKGKATSFSTTPTSTSGDRPSATVPSSVPSNSTVANGSPSHGLHNNFNTEDTALNTEDTALNTEDTALNTETPVLNSVNSVENAVNSVLKKGKSVDSVLKKEKQTKRAEFPLIPWDELENPLVQRANVLYNQRIESFAQLKKLEPQLEFSPAIVEQYIYMLKLNREAQHALEELCKPN